MRASSVPSLRRAAFTTAVLVLALSCAGARADKVTSKQITPIAGVSGTCSIETKAADKSLTYDCEFTNAGKVAVRFVFCAMADLNDKKIEEVIKDDREVKPIAGAKSFLLKQVGGNTGKLVCEVANANGGALSPASVYFGCKEIILQPGDRNKKFPIGSVAGYKLVTTKPGTNDVEFPFDKLKAGDFTVVYTDQVNLTTTPQKKFDPDGTCKDAKGQGNFIAYDEQSIAEGVRSQWAYQDKSFVDPYVVWQPLVAPVVPQPCDANGDGYVDVADIDAIFAARNTAAAPGDPRDVDRSGVITVNDARICTLRLTRQYVTYNDPPCVPTGFPAQVPQLPKCAVRAGLPPATSVDLNLFTWYTETEPLDERLPAVLDVVTQGTLTGLRVATSPPPGTPFDLLGGRHLFGSLAVCSSATTAACLAPAIAEGRRLEVTVNVTTLDPDNPSFLENGLFVQDTVPPRILSHAAGFDAGGKLSVVVVGSDATTSPIYAELWYSATGGASWQRAPMSTTPDDLEDAPTRTFAVAVGPFALGRAVQYFVVMNDKVANVVVFGPGAIQR